MRICVRRWIGRGRFWSLLHLLLAVLIAKSSTDARNAGEMRGCDETTLGISMERGLYSLAGVCVSALVGEMLLQVEDKENLRGKTDI